MKWHVELLPEAQEDFLNLDHARQVEVAKGIQRVSRNPGYPDGYGKPLGNIGGITLAGLYKIKFKKAGIRVVYKLKHEGNVMTVIIISVRADGYVYQEAEKRRKKRDL